MSKIFCEICGTAYSYTAKQCPICGCPKPDCAEFAVEAEELEQKEVRSAPVKGGRFSKSNVNKRLSSGTQRNEEPAPRKSSGQKKKKKTSSMERTLIITIICLLVAIVAVMAYIVINYFMPQGSSVQPGPEPTDTDPSPTETTVPPTTLPPEILCTDLTLTEKTIRFNEIGTTWLLSAVPTPADTTDTISYITSNPEVATVSADGKVTSVGEGSCTITVKCGNVSVNCQVICELPQETEPTETDPPIDMSKFKLNRTDFTLSIGETWLLYTGELDVTMITWTSSNERVATVVDGIVKGIGRGMCTVTAELNGVKLECVVYVN